MRGSPNRKWIIVVVAGLCIFTFFKFFIHGSIRAGYFEDDRRFAATGVDRFHSQFNAGQFQNIYKEASPAFQKTGGQSALISAMTRTKQKFGNVINAVQVGANTFPGGQVRFVYNTKFQKSNATEFFVWQSDGQKASLLQYQIFPGTTKP